MKFVGDVAGLSLKEGRDLLDHFDYRRLLTVERLQNYVNTLRWRAAVDRAVNAGRMPRDMRNFMRRDINEGRPDMARRWGMKYRPLSKRGTQELLDRLVAEGWIEAEPPRPNQPTAYRETRKGAQLRNMKFYKRIDRARADQIVAALIERAKAINADPERHYWVDRIRTFGSYNTDASDLGDVDVAIDYTPRPLPDNTRRRHVERTLWNRDRYLSFHHPSEIENLKIEARVIYQREG